MRQVKLLLWKRSLELKKEPLPFASGFFGSLLIIAEMYILYYVTPNQEPNSLEVIFYPLFITSIAQMSSSHCMNEKVSSLIESMKIAGLKSSSYWMSYFIRYNT